MILASPRSVLLALVAALLLSGCAVGTMGRAGTTGRPGKARRTAQENGARLEGLLARENGPFAKHPVSLLDGLVSGSVEASVPPKVECAKDAHGALVCSLLVDLGKDADGDANSIVCSATSGFRPFGPELKGLLREAPLSEVPRIETKSRGEGIAVSFVSTTERQEADSIRIGTPKLAVLYAHGYMTVCADMMAGGRKTFDRVVGQFFDGLKFKPGSSSPAIFSSGYQERAGERTTGFRYHYIATRSGDEPGFSEFSAAFSLRTDGKTWRVVDQGQAVERDDKGDIQSMRTLYWLDGKGPIVLSAKPSEDKKFRLKLEAGTKSDSLEASPKAPLGTEFWSAPELLKVSSGSASSYRYAILTLNDSDPSFRYITLTRSKPGLLLEDEETLSSSGKKAAKTAEARPKDELHIDGRGLVTKEVSSDSVSELIHTWGELPSLLGTRKARTGGATGSKPLSGGKIAK